MNPLSVYVLFDFMLHLCISVYLNLEAKKVHKYLDSFFVDMIADRHLFDDKL